MVLDLEDSPCITQGEYQVELYSKLTWRSVTFWVRDLSWVFSILGHPSKLMWDITSRFIVNDNQRLRPTALHSIDYVFFFINQRNGTFLSLFLGFLYLWLCAYRLISRVYFKITMGPGFVNFLEISLNPQNTEWQNIEKCYCKLLVYIFIYSILFCLKTLSFWFVLIK